MAQLIKTEEIEEGMTLAEPVSNKYGQTLLPAGITLTHQKAKILKTWNIKTVVVKTDSSDEEVEINWEMIERWKETLSKKMSWQPKNENESDLFQSAVLYLARTKQHNERE